LVKFDYRFLGLIPIVTVPAMIATDIFIFISLFLGTIALSYFCSRTGIKIGIELVTFTTVVTGVMFGMVPGAFTGMILVLIHDLMMGRIAPYLIIVIPTFGAVGALASTFSNVNIFILGIGLTLFSHVLFIVWQTVTSKFPIRYLPHFVVNVVINFFLFSNIAPKLLALLK
jgi:hypothetical protein